MVHIPLGAVATIAVDPRAGVIHVSAVTYKELITLRVLMPPAMEISLAFPTTIKHGFSLINGYQRNSKAVARSISSGAVSMRGRSPETTVTGGRVRRSGMAVVAAYLSAGGMR